VLVALVLFVVLGLRTRGAGEKERDNCGGELAASVTRLSRKKSARWDEKYGNWKN